MDPVTTTTEEAATASNTHVKKYSRYLSSQEDAVDANTIGGIMNGVVKEKLKIIPSNLTWKEQSDPVYSALVNDFMKPRIDEVSEHG
jgi:serine carboxypeptidase 1